MVTFFVIIITTLLFLDCLLLGLLILIQLPKKEAGVGVAFGGGATDALFGAGSGTALTKLTKYSAVAFFVLIFLLSIMKSRQSHGSGSSIQQQMEKQGSSQSGAPTPIAETPAAPAGSNTAAATNGTLLNLLPITNSAAPATSPVTNAPAAAPK